MNSVLKLSIVVALLFIPLSANSGFATETTDKVEKTQTVENKKAVSTGDKIYTWVDNRGNRIYSDVPREGAEEMKIQKGTDFKSPTALKSTVDPMIKLVTKANVYKKIQIVSPPNDATVRNNNGSFQVAISTNPTLKSGDKVRLEIDGSSVPESGSTIFSLNNINRGTHVLVASVVSSDGKVLVTSEAVTIHLHRNSR